MRPAPDSAPPDGPAGYALLVRAYARAQARGEADPAAAALRALGAYADTACTRTLAARLGVPWPAPARSASPPWPDDSLCACAAAAQRYARSAYALLGQCTGCGSRATAQVPARLAHRPVRSLGALHGTWCAAWQAERAARVGDAAYAAGIAALAQAATEWLHAARALVPVQAGDAHTP